MSISVLREKDVSGLRTELLALRKEQFNLRMQKATGQLSNTARFAEVRREIARVKTVMKEKAMSPSPDSKTPD